MRAIPVLSTCSSHDMLSSGKRNFWGRPLLCDVQGTLALARVCKRSKMQDLAHKSFQ